MAASTPSSTTPGPSPPTASISFAETTEENTSTEPIDRSMPEVMMTKVMPTPSTASTARFWLISEKLPTERKRLPPLMAKNATMTTQHPEDPHRLGFRRAASRG